MNRLTVIGAGVGFALGVLVCHDFNTGCSRTDWLTGALLILAPTALLALPGVLLWAVRRHRRPQPVAGAFASGEGVWPPEPHRPAVEHALHPTPHGAPLWRRFARLFSTSASGGRG